MDQRIIDLYDEYTHAPLPRRDFLDRLTVMLGGAAAIPAVLAALEPDYARAAAQGTAQVAAHVAADDPRIVGERVTMDDTRAYLVRPEGTAKAPGVVLVHENRGLNPYIEDVARRLAAAGFLALAPDLLSADGGTPSDPDLARDMIGRLDLDATVARLVKNVGSLAAHPSCTGAVGAVGFCWGGGMVNRLAIQAPETMKADVVKAVVAFYGPTPDPARVGSIKAALLLHYAGLDQRIDAGVPAYDEALTKAGVAHTIHMYEGVNHAFHNDTSAERYDEAAATLAWSRTIAFLKAHLGAA
jgi:carboxymethylenebutenolidase